MMPMLQFSLTDERSLPLLAVVVLALVYIILRPMFRRKDPLEKPFSLKSLSQQRSVERQMQTLLVELSEMARQISGQLDTRAARLEALLDEADRKLAELRAAGVAPGDEATRIAPVPTPPTPPTPPAPTQVPDPTDEPDPRHADVYALADEGCKPAEIAARLDRPRGEIELILALRTPAGARSG